MKLKMGVSQISKFETPLFLLLLFDKTEFSSFLVYNKLGIFFVFLMRADQKKIHIAGDPDAAVIVECAAEVDKQRAMAFIHGLSRCRLRSALL